MQELTGRDVTRARTASLLLVEQSPGGPRAVASWFGAMQAQDYASGVWSFGVRTGLSLAEVERSIANAEVLRTWPMRGTLHFIAAEDAAWLLATTGVRHLESRSLSKRWDYLGLNRAIADRTLEVLGTALSGRNLTRAETLAALTDAGIDTGGQRGYHLLWFSAQSGLTCIGPNQGKEQTYALLHEWAPQQRRVDATGALAELALRYFRSHGPTTRQDFAGWAGLTVAEAKAGIDDAGDALMCARYDDRDVYMSADLLDRAAQIIEGADRRRVRLLPGFDEFLLGYKDRSLQVPAKFSDRIVPGNNGVFQPTITKDGQVLGTWRRAVKRDHVRLTPATFADTSATLRRSITQAARDYGNFLGLPTEVEF